LKKAIQSADSLRLSAKSLQDLKQESLQVEPTSGEVREEYRQKYRVSLPAAVQRVEKGQKALNEALLQAEKNHPDQKPALVELKQKLQLAQAEFELQAKQQ
jgi:hypothetical protein